MGTVGSILGLAVSLGLLTVLGLVIAWLIRQLGRQPTLVEGNPMETARRRLAEGEVTVAQFEEIKERLRE